MSHCSPWLAGIGPICSFAVRTDHETRSCPRDCKADNGSLVCHGLDSVCVTSFIELKGDVVSIEAVLIGAKVDIGKGIG